MIAAMLLSATLALPAVAKAPPKPAAKPGAAQTQGTRPKLNAKRKQCVNAYAACNKRCENARGIKALSACKQKTNCFAQYNSCRGGRP